MDNVNRNLVTKIRIIFTKGVCMIDFELHPIQDLRAPFAFMSFKLYPLSNSKKRPGNWHDDLEILNIIEGSAEIYLNNTFFTVKKGDIVVFNSNYIHSIVPITAPVQYDCLIINSRFCIDNHIDIRSLLFQPHIKDDELSKLLQDLKNAFPREHKSPFTLTDEDRDLKYILPQRALVLHILSNLYCDHVISTNSQKIAHKDQKVKQAIEFINKNFQRTISLNEIAETVGLNSSYLSREFSKVTSISISLYINHLRCKYAKHLLIRNDIPIAKVSSLCGFTDPSYFSRVFLKSEGISPSEYQKKKNAQTKQPYLISTEL